MVHPTVKGRPPPLPPCPIAHVFFARNAVQEIKDVAGKLKKLDNQFERISVLSDPCSKHKTRIHKRSPFRTFFVKILYLLQLEDEIF